MGSRENETKSETSTAAAMVRAKGLNHWPASPVMKPMGTNTATMEKVVAATARPISSVPLNEAVVWSSPSSMCRTMFSRTTMASSMRMPMASERPRSDIVLSVKPKTHTLMNAARTETGRARPVMTVERHELRKRKTTSTVRSAPSRSVVCTSRTERETRSPASWTTASRAPAGRRGRSAAARAFTSSATAVVE